jgi:hypothetical protein
MKKIICAIWVVFLLSGNALAQDEAAVQVDVLSKSSASWEGSRLPDYPKGTPEVTILRINIPPRR